MTKRALGLMLLLSSSLAACNAELAADEPDAVQTEQGLFEESLAPGGAVEVAQVHAQRVTLNAQPGDLVEIVATGDTWTPTVDSYEGASRGWMRWEDVSPRTTEGHALRFQVRMRWPMSKMVFRHPEGDATRGNLTVTARLVEAGGPLMAMFDASPCAGKASLTDAVARLGNESAVTLGSARVLKRKIYCGTTCDPWMFGGLSTYNGNDVSWVAGGAWHTVGGATKSVVMRLRKNAVGDASFDIDEEAGGTIWRCRIGDERCVVQNRMSTPWGYQTIEAGVEQVAQVRSGCFYLKLAGGNAIKSYNVLNPTPSDRGELVVTGTF